MEIVLNLYISFIKYINLKRMDKEYKRINIIKEIKLYNDKAEIIFNSPLKRSPNSDSFFIFRKTIIYNSLQHNLPEIIEIKISFGL